MRAHIVKIGNSQGIRIPKPLLDQTGIKDDVELEVDKNRLIISPVSNPRSGWDDAFKAMAQHGDDLLMYGKDNLSHSWDDEEWRWE
jgi:antitoxin MazE